MSGQLGDLVVSLSLDMARFRTDLGRSTQEMQSAAQRMAGSVDGITSSVKLLAATWLAWQASSLIKDIATTAARYETLGVVMAQVGRNAGYTRAQVDEFAKGLQASGITMIESRNSLVRMNQANIDLSNSTRLARIAQDAAVIGNINSSEAFQQLVYGIQSANLHVLRTIGINVNFEESYKRLAAQLGKNADDLTNNEKTQARLNVVMEAGARISGTYEAAMGTAGKQLTSLPRYIEDFKVKMGEAFGPAITVLVKALTDEFKRLQEEIVKPDMQAKLASMANSAAEFGKAIIKTLEKTPDVISFLGKWGSTLVEVVATIKAAELAQLAYNSAVLRNPYVIAAMGGITISQAIKQSQGNWKAGVFDKSIPMESPDVAPGSGYIAGPGVGGAVANLENPFILTMQAQKAAALKVKDEVVKQVEGTSKDLAKAWDTVYKSLKFEASGYYDYEVQRITEQAAEFKQLGVGAVQVEQWKTGEMKKLIADRIEYERGGMLVFGGLQREELAKLKQSLQDWQYQDQQKDMLTLNPASLEEYKKLVQELHDEATKTKGTLRDAFTGWANGFSSSLNDMLWSANFTFSSIAQSFAKMLTQMFIQKKMVEPLFEAAGGKGGGNLFSLIGNLIGLNANGGVYSGAGIGSYSGQVVSRPTLFPFASGIGLMGEAGPEAILPLRRGADGRLGVSAASQQPEINVAVNVINQSWTPVAAKSGGVQFDGKQYIVTTILENIKNGGPLRSLFSGQGAR